MKKLGIQIRHAVPQDTDRVFHLCRLLSPDDYVLKAWPLWIKMTAAINLVAVAGDKIVGCWHAEPLTRREYWSQGTRVHPKKQGSGIGTALLRFLEEELKQRGIRTIRGSIAPDNRASLELVGKFGWRAVGRVCRREAEGRSPLRIRNRHASLKEAISLTRRWPVLASRPHLAHFRRAYFAMTEAHLKKLIEGRCVLVSGNDRAYAILEPRSGSERSPLWVVALAGEETGIGEILLGLSAQSEDGPAGVLVDGPDDPSVQSRLDELGFRPPENDGRYVIVERYL